MSGEGTDASWNLQTISPAQHDPRRHAREHLFLASQPARGAPDPVLNGTSGLPACTRPLATSRGRLRGTSPLEASSIPGTPTRRIPAPCIFPGRGSRGVAATSEARQLRPPWLVGDPSNTGRRGGEGGGSRGARKVARRGQEALEEPAHVDVEQ